MRRQFICGNRTHGSAILRVLTAAGIWGWAFLGLSQAADGAAGSTGASKASVRPAQPFKSVVGSDWKEYGDTAELRAARLFWWFRKDANANDFVNIVDDETFGQVARITFAANEDGAGSAPRMVTKLPVPLDSIWFRWRVKFSPGFTTRGETPVGHANSYKLAFWLWEGWDGRGQIEFSNTRQYILGCSWWRPGDTVRAVERRLPDSQHFGHVTTEWTDGQWYEYVIHYERLGETTARQHWWRRKLTEDGVIVDGPFVYTGVEITGKPAPRVRAVVLGANKNKNNPKDMYLYWGPWEVVDGSKYANPFSVPLR
jgi:hypothetical protein